MSSFANERKIGIREDYIDSLHGVNTLFHEVLHGIAYQYGMIDTLDKFNKEEKVVNTFHKWYNASVRRQPLVYRLHKNTDR